LLGDGDDGAGPQDSALIVQGGVGYGGSGGDVAGRRVERGQGCRFTRYECQEVQQNNVPPAYVFCSPPAIHSHIAPSHHGAGTQSRPPPTTTSQSLIVPAESHQDARRLQRQAPQPDPLHHSRRPWALVAPACPDLPLLSVTQITAHLSSPLRTATAHPAVLRAPLAPHPQC
jgi:hypothetical protein